MTDSKKKLFLAAITVKVNRGQDLETVLAAYKTLTDAEKDELRQAFTAQE